MEADVDSDAVPEREATRFAIPENRLDALCRACVASAGVDAAGLAVPSLDDLPLDIVVTDDAAAVLGELQFASGEGPAVDAMAGSPVFVADLAGRLDGRRARWPAFLEGARLTGVGAVFAFPVVADDRVLAVLTLYRRSPGALGAAELQEARSVVDALGVLLLDADTVFAEANELGDRAVLIHRGAGLVAAQLDTSVHEALLRLRQAASAETVPVHEIARKVLDGSRRFGGRDS